MSSNVNGNHIQQQALLKKNVVVRKPSKSTPGRQKQHHRINNTSIIQWLSQDGKYNSKHFYDYYKNQASIYHPLVVVLLFYTIIICVSIQSHDLLLWFFQQYSSSQSNQSNNTKLLSVDTNSNNSCHTAAMDTSTTSCNHPDVLLISSNTNTNTMQSIIPIQWIAYFLFFYAIFIILIWRIFFVGTLTTSVILYEYCWLCTVTLIIGGICILLDKPYIIWSYCAMIGIDQLLWYVDLTVAFITWGKVFPIGVAKYLIWPGATWRSRLSTTHHLWTIPLLLYTTLYMSNKNNDGIVINENYFILLLSFIIQSTLVILSRWLIPSHIYVPPFPSSSSSSYQATATTISDKSTSSSVIETSNTRVLHQQQNQDQQQEQQQQQYILFLQQHKLDPKNSTYMNVNLAHDFWKDVDYKFLKFAQGNIGNQQLSVVLYLLNLLLLGLVFNSCVFIVLRICVYYYCTYYNIPHSIILPSFIQKWFL